MQVKHVFTVLCSFGINYFSVLPFEGSHLRVASCLLLPAIQLVVGISHPSWASLPFFIGSCVGLVDWSLTSNFLGLFRWFLNACFCYARFFSFFPLGNIWFYFKSPFGFSLCLWFWRWWRPLQLYAGFNICLLYVYQLPVELPSIIERVADLIGLYKISANSEWPKICSCLSLIYFYMVVCNCFLNFFCFMWLLMLKKNSLFYFFCFPG